MWKEFFLWRRRPSSFRGQRRHSFRDGAFSVAGLAALIEHLDFAPAWVAANSFGASIAIRLAKARPGLFRGLIVHEPPLYSLLGNDADVMPILADVQRKVQDVVQRISAGDHAGAAEQFVETVAFGPGTWRTLSPAFQQRMVGNAPTFLDEANDPEQIACDVQAIGRFRKPVLFTLGDHSPPTFALVVDRLKAALPHAEILTLAGAGPIPHTTHPDAYVQTIIRFTHEHAA